MDGLAKDLSRDFGDFAISYIRRSENNSMLVYHFHENYEIYYQLSGEKCFFIGSRSYHLRKGDIALIDSNVIHRTTAYGGQGYQRVLIDIQKSFLRLLGEDISRAQLFSCFGESEGVLRLREEQQELVEALLERMLTTNADNDRLHRAYVETLVVELLILLNLYVRDRQLHVVNHPDSCSERISPVISYINRHFMDPISLPSLAEEFHMSISSLTRAFRRVTGYTFTQYLNCVRVKEAQRLLRMKNLNVTQVSEKVGYNSINHFCRVFRRISGRSALEFRKAL